MSSIFNTDNKEATQIGIYTVLTAAASVPVFFGLDAYLNMIGAAHDEAIATALTLVLFGCIYIGGTSLQSGRRGNAKYPKRY